MISLPEDVARKLGLFDGSEAVVVIDSFDFCIVTEVRKINEAIETLKRWRDARLDDAIWTIEEYKAEFPKIYEEMCREGLVE